MLARAKRAGYSWFATASAQFIVAALFCLSVALLNSGGAAAASKGEDLGTVPPECTGANYEYGDCLVQTRLGTLSVSPHVVHAGGLLTGTISGDCKVSDQPCPIEWSTVGDVVSGCGQSDKTCVMRIPAHWGTQPYTTFAVGITNEQGTGVSRDYYAIIGKGRYELSGHVKAEDGSPMPGVKVRITGEGVRAQLVTDALGGYSVVLKRGRYVVSAGSSAIKPVKSGDCAVVKRTCHVNLNRDRTADFGSSSVLAVEYRMRPRLIDANGDGMIDYPTEFNPGKFPVWVKVSKKGGAPCDSQASYRFKLDKRTASATNAGACTFTVEARKQGKHKLEVSATSPSGAQAQGTQKVNVRDFLIVGLGDSVGSGEGNPDVPAAGLGGALWQDQRCDRSANSFEAQAAKSIEEGANHQASVTFLHLACSGAGISTGVTGPYFGISPGGESLPLNSQVSQLHKLVGSRKVDAVIVSIGANDIGFGDIVEFCSLHATCYSDIFKDNKTLATITRQKIRALPSHYRALASRLKAAGVPASRVYITQYYDPTHGSDGAVCPNILGLMGAADAQWAYKSVVRPLNVQIATAARQWDWHLVSGAQQGFATHGYCASDSWIVNLTTSLAQQGDKNGTMHPNIAGHQFIGGLVFKGLKRELLPGGKPSPVN